MSMIVNHNLPALSTYNVVNNTSNALQKSINKLSTGLRINSAADDAAGLAISEKMRAQIRGLDQAVGNAQDGISMIQTAEGALNETHSILQRMRELSVQAANDTLTNQDRGYIQEEVDQLRDEVTRIGNTTQFNKKKLLNGDAAALWSSSDDSTKAIINGGLRSIDKFGQKNSVEGNYKITIKAEPGVGEVQKSDIFTIKHANSTSNEYLNTPAGVNDLSVNDLPAASYTIKSGTAGQITAAKANLTGVFGVSDSYTKYYKEVNMTASGAGTGGSFVINVGGKDYSAAIASNQASGAVRTAIKQVAAAAGLTVKSAAGSLTLEGSKSFTLRGIGTAATAVASFTGTAASTSASAAFSTVMTATPDDDELKTNASVLFEVTDVDTTAGTVTVKATANKMGTDGSLSNTTVDGIVLKAGSATGTNLGSTLGLGSDSSAFNLKLGAGYTEFFHKGDKFTYNLSPKGTADEMAVTVHGDANGSWPDGWANSPAQSDLRYTIDADKVQGKDLHLQHYYLNENTGEVMEGDITLTTDATKFSKANSAEKTLATFDANYVGQTANGGTKLRDLDKFWNSEGRFLLEDPQTITINQGDGKSTSITLYANDTLDDVAKKMNDAIGQDLGQARYLTNGSGVNDFVTFTTGSGTLHEKTQEDNTSQSVAGTFLVRSIVPGSNGEIRFSGDEDVINAFSLNTIQNSKETRYTASIQDAHTGASVASNVEVTGNKLIGVINPNVDVEFDNMAGVTASWNDDQKKFAYSTKDYTTTLHLADNTTVFQIGANEGEDMGINIGDMRADALGLNKVLVTDRDSASRSITVIDNAIDKVSMQRSKLGAYQNRLEHTVNNLTTSSENLTAAESRIRDTDMAKEMLNFSKLQIMLQAGNSMLSQANQLPQNVLSLIR